MTTSPRSASPPDAIWMFDSSRQLLVFREPGSNRAAVFAEAVLERAGWNAEGIRMSLPRCSIQM